MTIASGRDLALIYFIIPSIIISAMPLIALYFAARSLRIGRRRLMPYIHLAQYWAARVARLTRQGSDAVAKPFIAAASFGRQVEAVLSQLSAFIREREAS